MKHIWSYFIVVLCFTLTSAKIMDFLGNRTGFHDNLTSDVKDEKLLTPPTTSGLIIDSHGYPGNSNEKRIQNIKTDGLPPFIKKALWALFNQSENSGYDIIPFSKEDIIKMGHSNFRKMMCGTGGQKTPFKC